jgi:NTE family protein
VASRRVLLADGGIYDNLGVTCLEPGSSASIGYNHFAPEYIICCDAGHGVFQDYPVPYLWGPRMVRSFQSVFCKAQNATQNRFHLLAATGQIRGFLLAYLGQIDNRLTYFSPQSMWPSQPQVHIPGPAARLCVPTLPEQEPGSDLLAAVRTNRRQG